MGMTDTFTPVGSTVVISPPDGDMARYLSSLARVALLGLSAIAPGHGGLITTPDAALRTLIELVDDGVAATTLRDDIGAVENPLVVGRRPHCVEFCRDHA